MSKRRSKNKQTSTLAFQPIRKEVVSKIKAADPAELERLPVSYQEIEDYFSKYKEVNPFLLRAETFKRIEKLTGVPLICYITKTTNLQVNVPTYIDDNDLTGFGDLVTHLTQ